MPSVPSHEATTEALNTLGDHDYYSGNVSKRHFPLQILLKEVSGHGEVNGKVVEE